MNTGSDATALASIFRAQSGRVLAALIVQLQDFDLAEEALQDAMTQALRLWPTKGVPDNGAAWLLTVARRKAIDHLRRQKTQRAKAAEISLHQTLDQDVLSETDYVIPDERLRLIFTCCHPALSPDAQVALTLRTLCGLSACEIARAFLVSETTMNQRLTRAKAKIRTAAIAYEIPDQTDIFMRLEPVLAVIYLIYNESYLALEGDTPISVDLAAEALRLVKILRKLLPHPEVSGLLALITLHTARRGARINTAGDLVALQDQDRSLWDRGAITKGKKLLLHTLAGRNPGPYQIQAAISALHSESSSWADTDWPQIIGLYGALHKMTPSPVVALNRAVAIANGGDFGRGLQEIRALESRLSTYQPYFAARADVLARFDKPEQARLDYAQAIALSKNAAERRFLQHKLSELT
ncbi:MAG: RNA polymerase sigma factor [Paracoccaceae bacterium]